MGDFWTALRPHLVLNWSNGYCYLCPLVGRLAWEYATRGKIMATGRGGRRFPQTGRPRKDGRGMSAHEKRIRELEARLEENEPHLRSVQTKGPSLAVTMPCGWVKEHGLRPRDLVKVTLLGAMMIVQPVDGKPELEPSAEVPAPA